MDQETESERRVRVSLAALEDENRVLRTTLRLLVVMLVRNGALTNEDVESVAESVEDNFTGDAGLEPVIARLLREALGVDNGPAGARSIGEVARRSLGLAGSPGEE